MAHKNKFDVVAAVKDASRHHIGILPLTKVVPNKKRKQASKRPTKHQLMAEAR